MDFFKASCQSGPLTNAQFGVCDNQLGLPAYVDVSAQTPWTATVQNSTLTPVIFTAIDKCVLNDGDAPGQGRCDGMLTTSNCLYLLELKDQKSGWRQHAINQLESTIQLLLAQHQQAVSNYRHKKAFACNRQHPSFAEIDHDLQRRFFRTYGFRIDIQATVVIVP